MERPRIAVYVQRHHYPTDTFIIRHIRGIQSDYKPILFVSNKPIISSGVPEYEIFGREKSPSERIWRAFRKAIGDYAVLSQSQLKSFEEQASGKGVGLIHAHFGPSGIEILPLAERMKIPLLVTFHGYDASVLLRNPKYVRQLKTVFQYAHLTAVSNHMAKELIKVGANPGKISIVYWGVPANNKFIARKSAAAKIRDKEEIRFLQISGFAEKKGHIYTLMAFKEFLKQYENSSLTFGGGGAHFEQVKAMCEKLGLGGKVVFLGPIDPARVYDVLATADIFLHHSVTTSSGDEEGIPSTIMEAMVSGLPVVSTYHSGIPELIDDGKDGYLVEERNIQQYVEKINQAINSPPELARKASEKVQKNFNIDRLARDFTEIYDRLIGIK